MTLLLSEKFYSIQGEGVTSGYPSYFIRLTNCNLSCGASQKMLNRLRKQEIELNPGDFKGDLHEEGKAKWTCDTIPVWIKGEEVSYQTVIDDWKKEGVYEDIRSGLIHVIWSGGEPTIKYHQKAIVEFTNYWVQNDDWLESSFGPVANFPYYYEIETNGTIYIQNELFYLLSQINCSAKLSNSGMAENKRIVPEAIKRIMSHENYWFKFVISTEEDIIELMETYARPFEIPMQRVVCMPGLDAQENFHERTRFVMEMAKKYKFIGLTRLHVSAWDKTTGV